MITLEQAQHCAETLEDVFTEEGDAVVITLIAERNRVVRVNGERHPDEWIPLEKIWLSLHSKAPGDKDLHPSDKDNQVRVFKARVRDNGTYGVWMTYMSLWVVNPADPDCPYEFENESDAQQKVDEMNARLWEGGKYA